jgi:hypothetical protein
VTRYYFLCEGCCLKVAVLFLWGAFSDEQFAVQSLNGPSRAEPVTIIYCLIWDSPVFICPRNRVAQLYPWALSSLYVASYNSQGYGGGILTLPQPGGLGPSIYIPQEQDVPVQSLKSNVKATLWPTVSQYVLVSSPLWDLRPDINYVWNLLSCLCGVPFWWKVRSVSCQSLHLLVTMELQSTSIAQQWTCAKNHSCGRFPWEWL